MANYSRSCDRSPETDVPRNGKIPAPVYDNRITGAHHSVSPGFFARRYTVMRFNVETYLIENSH